MSEKLYDVTVKTGSYQKDGETKNRYLQVGSILKGEHGPYMIMERTFNPAGLPNPDDRSSLILSLFKPRGSDGDSNSQMPQKSVGKPPYKPMDTSFEDEIPF